MAKVRNGLSASFSVGRERNCSGFSFFPAGRSGEPESMLVKSDLLLRQVSVLINLPDRCW